MVGLLLAVVLGLGPMVLYAGLFTLADRYEREPPALLIGVFLWGLVVAATAALVVNTFFHVGFSLVLSEGLAEAGTAVLVAPVVEETVKGLAVLGVFLFARHELDSHLDGLLYGALVGFGFAAAENVNYLLQGWDEGGLGGLAMTAFIRVILIAFLHAGLTGLTGLGFAAARLGRGAVRWLAPLLGYGAAMGLHALHNLLASLGSGGAALLGIAADWLGFALLFGYLAILVWREGWIMRECLAGEVTNGVLLASDYRVACSLWGQMQARGAALGAQRRVVARFFQLCGELAFRKYRVRRLGVADDPGVVAEIEALREALRGMRPAPP